ncbi:HNH endonuclease signature motif containing protein [Massilia sp. CCM 8734]|uniref:HNH endonuclease n=1 Tax=Massilia sp. CCM 8734 TaxID=2609283 RepID=UPI00141DC115|nr:HNH endonuclease signature motif containing protein [Massilia sp. CCM 8734]NHZ98514.1 HNH endonuclease [Massilia sp. CCM 8734]
MMRLKAPTRDFASTLDECIEGVTGNKIFKAKMQAAKSALVLAGTAYSDAGAIGELYCIAPIDTTADKDPIVIGDLHKSELVNLYQYYFVNEEKASRAIYDKLLNSAEEDCPFCGGIGRPRNLDHFLPKAHFPQFSTLPQNLIPSCRDCNMDGKAQGFATQAADQLIQPYVDNERFFTHQWIFAKCVLNANDLPTSIYYYVNPPREWDKVNKARVQKHFLDFGLEKRYAIESARLLPTTLEQIANLRIAGLSSHAIANCILTPGINKAPFINHWMKGMYQALHDYVQA